MSSNLQLLECLKDRNFWQCEFTFYAVWKDGEPNLRGEFKIVIKVEDFIRILNLPRKLGPKAYSIESKLTWLKNLVGNLYLMDFNAVSSIQIDFCHFLTSNGLFYHFLNSKDSSRHYFNLTFSHSIFSLLMNSQAIFFDLKYFSQYLIKFNWNFKYVCSKKPKILRSTFQPCIRTLRHQWISNFSFHIVWPRLDKDSLRTIILRMNIDNLFKSGNNFSSNPLNKFFLNGNKIQ